MCWVRTRTVCACQARTKEANESCTVTENRYKQKFTGRTSSVKCYWSSPAQLLFSGPVGACDIICVRYKTVYPLSDDMEHIENDASNNSCIRCRGDVFTEPLPNNCIRIHIQILWSLN